MGKWAAWWRSALSECWKSSKKILWCLKNLAYFSACCPGKSVWLMLCTAFRTFQFCPHANEPRVGIRACFSHAERTKSGQTDLTHPCCGDEKRALPDLWSAHQAWFCSRWGCWSRGARMQTHERVFLSLEMWRSELSLLSQQTLHIWNVFSTTQSNVQKKCIAEFCKNACSGSLKVTFSLF